MFLNQFFKQVSYVFWKQGSSRREKSPLQRSIELELARFKREGAGPEEQIPFHT